MMSLRRFTWSIITRSWKHLRLRRKTNHQFSERSEQKASFIRAPNQAAHAEIANAPADPAEVALQVLETDWAALMRIQCSPVKYLSAELLAQHFVGYLRSQPPLLGRWIRSNWIRDQYPLFCSALHLEFRPPYQDFANSLAQIVPRRRMDIREKGRRVTVTAYRVT
jgi:hypothetical protein